MVGGPCPECGFNGPTVGPADAAAAARSFHRRWRALLERPGDDDPDLIHRRPAPGQPSALDHAAAAAAGLAAAAAGLQAVQSGDGAPVDVDLVPAAGAAASRRLGAVLDDIAAASLALVDAVGRVHGDDWARTGVLPDGRPVHALDVARAGVHAGAHHLRAAERVIGLVRLRSGAEDRAE